MRTQKRLMTVAAALALLILPVAAQARDRSPHGRSGARSHANAPRAVGVVRSFRNGILTIRLAGRGSKSSDVTSDTQLTCVAGKRQASRRRAKRQHRRTGAGRARAATEPGDDTNTGDAPDTGDDPSTGDDPGADAGDDTNSGDDPGTDAGDGPIADEDPGDAADDQGADVQDESQAQEPRRAKAHGCATGALRRGTRIKAAKLAAGGGSWKKIVLLRR